MNKKPMIAVAVLAILLLSTFVSAFSTLGLSRVDFSSNDDKLNKPAWLLTVVEDGNEQSAIGTFESEDIERSDGATAANDITISITDSKNVCEYQFIEGSVPIYSVQVTRVPWVYYVSQCEAIPGAFYARRSGLDGYCFSRTKTATLAPLSTPTTVVESTINVKVGTESVQGVVNNIGQKNVNLGSRAYASWNGNLQSGAQCPAPLDSGVTGVKSGNVFVPTNKAAYDSYHVDQSDLLACVAATQGQTAFQSCVNTYNAKSKAVIAKTTKEPFSTMSISGGKAAVSLPAIFQYPVITLRVDASWLGIFLPVGEPDIISASDVTFLEGSLGKTTVVVKNIGSGKGVFTLGVTCDSPADRTGTSQSVSLAAGETKTVVLSISGQAGDDTVETSCKVTAVDSENPSKTDSEQFDVTIKPIALCTPAASRCLDKTIEICSVSGAKWVTSQVCPNGCVVNEGLYSCSEPVACSTDSDCDDGDATTKDSCVGVLETQCKYVPTDGKEESDFSLGLFIGSIIVAIIGGAIVGYYAMPLRKVTKYGKWVHLVLVLAVAVGLFFLVPIVVVGIATWFKELFSFGW